MAAADLATWRKQNSDPVTVDMVLSDGTEMRAIVMIPREKGLRDVFNVTDTFLEVECLERGPIVFQRDALRSVRPAALPKAEQLARRMAAIEKLKPHQALGLLRAATPETVAEAHARLKAAYDPARATDAGMPAEVVEYMAAMCRRFDAANAEINALGGAVKPAA